MAPRIYTDIEIKGVRYATADDAARAVGVTPARIRAAIRLGQTDRLGVGRGSTIDPMPIRIRGVTYANARAAAAAIGVKVTAIYSALSQGRIDRVGLPRKPNMARAKPCSIAGMSWPSEAAACRDMGLPVEYISHARSKGSDAMAATLLRRAMELKARREAASRKKREAAMARRAA
ncbi:hypothetical protein D2T31_04910 [Sinirhodobacter populi]|uniref:Nuclease-associated modular DNA-binding 1 domain-containing protein n=1 Tax=Paenirhodobacter populi TaxID=2306993 RepID=A0A443KF99_9RHOB|nr:hypothetical protein [Sinirhodobacter populi]RWR31342.1 hypothetical protein D2T31_04910 [Sinirhodobacter populi]